MSECEEERESYVEFVCEIESEEKKERSLEWMKDKGYIEGKFYGEVVKLTFSVKLPYIQ